MLRVLELFGGIGAPRRALERLGIPFETVDYVEIDKHAVKSYNAMYLTNFEPQDISGWDKDIEVDMIFHGSPCQDFSLAGKQAGGDKDSGTRSSLLYETVRIVEKTRPKYVIWENVKNVISKNHRHNFDNYLKEMENLGYTNYYQVLNSKDYGIPQNRERVFTISILDGDTFKFPVKQELHRKLKSLLEDEVDEKYYLSEKMLNYVLDMNEVQKGTTWENRANNGILNKEIALTIGVRSAEAQRGGVTNFVIEGLDKEIKVKAYKEIITLGNYSPSGHNASRIVDKEGIAPTVMENHGTVTGVLDNLRIRKLTPKECWRLMGFDDEDFDKASKVNSNAQLYKQAGNSIVVDVLEAIFRELLLKDTFSDLD